MKWSDLANGLGKIAPVLGGVIAGPAGASVGSMLSSFLGVENSPDAVSRAMLDPGAAAQIIKFELEHKAKLAEISLETTRIELADIQHARTAHKDTPIPGAICLMLTIMVAAGGWMLFNQSIPTENREFAYLIFGALVAKWGDSIAYFVGTTRSSKEKDVLLAKR